MQERTISLKFTRERHTKKRVSYGHADERDKVSDKNENESENEDENEDNSEENDVGRRRRKESKSRKNIYK